MSQKKVKNPVNNAYVGDGYVLAESSLIVLRGRSWVLSGEGSNRASHRSLTSNNDVDPLLGYRICLKRK